MQLEPRVLQNPVVLFSILPFNPPFTPVEEAVRRRLRLFDMLTSEGYTVRTAGPLEPKANSAPWQAAHLVEAHNKDYLIRLPSMNDQMMLWPRDMFQTYCGQVFASSGAEAYTQQVLAALGTSCQVNVSDYGEGGMVVHSEDIYICSDFVYDSPPSVFSDKNLQTIPSCSIHLPNSDLAHRSGDHIDTEVNIAITAQARLLFVNEEYRLEFLADVLNVSRKVQADLIVIPKQAMHVLGVNFVSLPDGRYLVPQDTIVAKVLKERLGRRAVIEWPVEPNEDYGVGGGLRCSSNVII